MAIVRVSELVSKPLIALSSADLIGTVGNIAFDAKLTKGVMLKIYNDEDESDASVSFVELKKLRSTDADACTVASRLDLTHEWTQNTGAYNNPMNCGCYNQDGKHLGNVKDVVLDGTRVTAIVVGEREFPPSDLISFSDRLLIFNDTGAPIKLPRKKPKPPAPNTDGRSVSLHRIDGERSPLYTFAVEGGTKTASQVSSVANESGIDKLIRADSVPKAQKSASDAEKAPLTPSEAAPPYGDTPARFIPTVPTFTVAAASATPQSTMFPVPTTALPVPRTELIPEADGTQGAAVSAEYAPARTETNRTDAPARSQFIQNDIENDEKKPPSLNGGIKATAIAEPEERLEGARGITLPLKMPPLGRVTPAPSGSAQAPYNFLIGKTVKGAILAADGTTLAPDSCTVTPQIISAVKAAGKLVQLALHAE